MELSSCSPASVKSGSYLRPVPKEGKGDQKGVFHLDELPDLEFRLGGFHQDGDKKGIIKQLQSVVPPTPRDDGTAREWIGSDVLDVPDAAVAFLEDLGKRKAIQAEARQAAAEYAASQHTQTNGKPKAKTTTAAVAGGHPAYGMAALSG